MVDILRNTLDVIGKIINCPAAYVLKIESGEIEIIASFNNSENLSDLIIDSVNRLNKQGKLNKQELLKLPAFKKITQANSLNSVFIKELQSEKNNLTYFVILFSREKGYFEKEAFSDLEPLIDNFCNVIKMFDGSSIKSIKDKRTEGYNPLYGSRILQSIFDASEDLVFILDKDGYIKNVNEYGAACLDYETNELEGTHLIELVASKNKQLLAESFQKILEEEVLVSFEAIFVSKFGNEIVFQMNCKRINFDDNSFNVIGVGKNVTESRNYEDKIKELNVRLLEANRIVSIEKQRSIRQKAILSELNRMKSEFVSNISHELRTPLASIIGFSETISSDPNMPEEMRNEFNDIILNEGKRLAKLINEMLDISKLEGGEIELIKNDFDAVKFLEEAIEANQKLFENKEMIVTTEFPSEHVILKGDKEKLAKVLNNILSNAVKFTPHKGRINISALSLYKEFEITISDTGAGIPEKDIPYIFQKFYRVSRPGTEIPGTGLGLVFVKQIVDLHKGFITIQSEVNKGTTVILKLPKESKV